MSATTDKLVELFISSCKPGFVPGESPLSTENTTPDLILDAEAIRRGVETSCKIFTSNEALRAGNDPAATFVLLAMALEEKPKLQLGAFECYKKALELSKMCRDTDQNRWERITILQQLGKLCINQGRPEDAKGWLADCAQLCSKADGHPKDSALFGGSFSTPQTRSEFAVTIERFRAKACFDLGDNNGANQHIAEAKRLDALAGGDAVARLTAQAATKEEAGRAADVNGNSPKDLWAAKPDTERRLKEYRHEDAGPCVLLILDLNDHLGMGEDASACVESLQQFRVHCESRLVDVQLRLRHKGKVCHFRLLLDNLIREIVPEDSVPKLKGRPGKRRLEIMLFKAEKDASWTGDLVGRGKVPEPLDFDKKKKTAKPAVIAAQEAPKGSVLNPLTPEELARLPRPGGGASDNRPSSWQQQAQTSAPSPAPEATVSVSGPVSAPVSSSAALAASPVAAPVAKKTAGYAKAELVMPSATAVASSSTVVIAEVDDDDDTAVGLSEMD